MHATQARPNGLVLTLQHYTRPSRASIVVPGLVFPNGLAMHSSESFFVVAALPLCVCVETETHTHTHVRPHTPPPINTHKPTSTHAHTDTGGIESGRQTDTRQSC